MDARRAAVAWIASSPGIIGTGLSPFLPPARGRRRRRLQATQPDLNATAGPVSPTVGLSHRDDGGREHGGSHPTIFYRVGGAAPDGGVTHAESLRPLTPVLAE